jgi:YD repeat-containing protein
MVDAVAGTTRAFDVDVAGRVTAVRAAGWTEGYFYDLAGRVARDAASSEVVGGLTGAPRAYDGSLVTRAGAGSYGYDRQGRMVTRSRKRLSQPPETWQFRYDADDRMVAAVSTGEHWSYSYDAFGRRVSKQRLEVKDSSKVPIVGQPAIATKTLTVKDVPDVAQLSSGTQVDPAMYQVSLDQALTNGKPTALLFATPAFCQTKQCGPTLDSIKTVAASEPDMTFINVEPYKMAFANNSLQPVLDTQGYLQATDVTNAWGLLTEPWIFVVDKTGVVRGSYSLIVSADELKTTIASVR